MRENLGNYTEAFLVRQGFMTLLPACHRAYVHQMFAFDIGLLQYVPGGRVA